MPAGFVSGPSRLNAVRTPISLRVGPAWRIAGWKFGANRNAKPTSRRAAVADAAPWVQTETWPGLGQMAQLQKMLWAAKRPLGVIAGPRWSEAAVAAFRRFAERFDLPVACSFRCSPPTRWTE